MTSIKKYCIVLVIDKLLRIALRAVRLRIQPPGLPVGSGY
jgi:hypothetical protein